MSVGITPQFTESAHRSTPARRLVGTTDRLQPRVCRAALAHASRYRTSIERRLANPRPSDVSSRRRPDRKPAPTGRALPCSQALRTPLPSGRSIPTGALVHPPARPPGSLSPAPEPTRDSVAVALVIQAATLCVPCIMASTDLALGAVLDAFRVIEARDTLFRTWGPCRACRKKNRAVFRLG